jgi:hypothetical protein
MFRLLRWALVIFFLWYMLTSPQGAAGWVHGFLSLIAHAGNSLSSFVDSLLNGLPVLTVIVAAVLGYRPLPADAEYVRYRTRNACGGIYSGLLRRACARTARASARTCLL